MGSGREKRRKLRAERQAAGTGGVAADRRPPREHRAASAEQRAPQVKSRTRAKPKTQAVSGLEAQVKRLEAKLAKLVSEEAKLVSEQALVKVLQAQVKVVQALNKVLQALNKAQDKVLQAQDKVLQAQDKVLQAQDKVLQAKLQEVTWEEWVNLKLITQPLVYDLDSSGSKSTDRNIKLPPVRKWENFTQEVTAHVKNLKSMGRRRADDFRHLKTTALKTHTSIVFLFVNFLSCFFLYDEFNGATLSLSNTSSGTPVSRGAKARKTANAVQMVRNRKKKLKRTAPDVEAQIGSKTFFIVEVKKPRLFRCSAEVPPADLVNSRSTNGLQDAALRQTMKHLRRRDTGYSMLSSFDVSYFIRRCVNREGDEHLEISDGICWDSTGPSLIGAMHYALTLAKDKMGDSYKRVRQTSSTKAPENDDDDSAADGDVPQPPSRKGPARDTRSRSSGSQERESKRYNRRRSGSQERELKRYNTRSSGINRVNGLQDIAEEELHLESVPFASGRSADVVAGVYMGHHIAVKLTEPNSSCHRGLQREAEIYYLLRDLWGKHIPKLIVFGTTAFGQVVFLATELVDGSTLSDTDITPPVAMEARAALAALHSRGIIHGDVHGGNILVSEDGVRFIDFGNSHYLAPGSVSHAAACQKELKDFAFLIQERATGLDSIALN